jgi:hypothetical protein
LVEEAKGGPSKLLLSFLNFFNFRFSTTISVACSIVALNCCRSSNANYFLISNNQPTDRPQVNRQRTFLYAPTVCSRSFGTMDKRVCQEFTIDILQQTSKTLASYSQITSLARGGASPLGPQQIKNAANILSVSRLLRHFTRCYIYCYQQLVRDRQFYRLQANCKDVFQYRINVEIAEACMELGNLFAYWLAVICVHVIRVMPI